MKLFSGMEGMINGYDINIKPNIHRLRSRDTCERTGYMEEAHQFISTIVILYKARKTEGVFQTKGAGTSLCSDNLIRDYMNIWETPSSWISSKLCRCKQIWSVGQIKSVIKIGIAKLNKLYNNLLWINFNCSPLFVSILFSYCLNSPFLWSR